LTPVVADGDVTVCTYRISNRKKRLEYETIIITIASL